MKKIALLMLLVALTACEKSIFPLSSDAALTKAERIMNQYPNRDWYVSKNIIEPSSVLQYSHYGGRWDRPELMHEFVSPDYRAWLVMLGEDTSSTYADTQCLHLFINVDTGAIEQVWLDGQVIVEWGSTPYSRFIQKTGSN